jgi:hypothetical protein
MKCGWHASSPGDVDVELTASPSAEAALQSLATQVTKVNRDAAWSLREGLIVPWGRGTRMPICGWSSEKDRYGSRSRRLLHERDT